MKTLFKVFIGLLAFNAIIGNLRRDGVISGHITINYPRLVKSMSNNIFIEFVSEDNPVQYPPTNNAVQVIHNHQELEELPVYYQNQPEERLEDLFDDIPSNQTNVHIFTNGETLMTLSSIYGVPRESIKKTNGIRHERDLRPGQIIWIPAS